MCVCVCARMRERKGGIQIRFTADTENMTVTVSRQKFLPEVIKLKGGECH